MNLKIDPQGVFGAQISKPGKGLKEITDPGDFWLILFALLFNPEFKASIDLSSEKVIVGGHTKSYSIYSSSIDLSSEKVTETQIQEGLPFKGPKFTEWLSEEKLSPLQGLFPPPKEEISMGKSSPNFGEISREEITVQLESLLKSIETKGKELPRLENLFHSLKEGKHVAQETVLQAIKELSTLARENKDQDINSILNFILEGLIYLRRENEVFTGSKKGELTDTGQEDRLFHLVEAHGLKRDKVKKYLDNQSTSPNRKKPEKIENPWKGLPIKDQIEKLIHKKEGHIPSRKEAKDNQAFPWPPSEERTESSVLNKGQGHKAKGISVANHLFLEKPLDQAKAPEHLIPRGHHFHHQENTVINIKSPESGPHHPRPLISLEPSQIPDFVKELVLKPNRLGRNEARIRLEPPHLGELHVTLSVDKGEVRLLFTVEHPQAAQALHQEIHQLAKSLAEVGLQLGGCQIDLSGGKHQPFQEQRYVDFRPMAPEKDLSLASSEARINRRPKGLIDLRV